MTEVEIPDSPEPRPDAQAEGESPYRNLLVPLVVVPALIVMVLVVIFTLFGAIAGEEATPSENVERLLSGGSNERTQAAFNLVRQALEDWEREARSDEPLWNVDESLLPDLRRAWEQNANPTSADEVPIPLALGILMAQLGDPDGVSRLAEMTRLSPELDPRGEFRVYAGFALGSLGERLGPADRELAAEALIDLLDSPDPGLRAVGVVSLQTLPTPATFEALRGLLDDRALEIRGNAALSLARLGDPSGEAVLVAMLDPAPYEAEHEGDPAKWARRTQVDQSRRKALEALVGLGRVPDRAALEGLAEDDPDPGIRDLALRLLRDEEG